MKTASVQTEGFDLLSFILSGFDYLVWIGYFHPTLTEGEKEVALRAE